MSSSSREETLRYASPSRSATDAAPGKAGLVTEWTQQQKGASANGATTAETFAYTYDKAGRLTNSVRYLGTATTSDNKLTEQGISYDRSGNLTALTRRNASGTATETLSYSYTGPKRTNTGWTYDNHGNVTADPQGSMTLAWNILDLPRTLTSGSASTQRAYLADGTLAQVYDGSTTRIYLGDMVFTRTGTSGTPALESAAWEGGRLLNGSGTDKVLYYVTDHLGSVRTIKDGSGTIRQRFDYYPFGTVSRVYTSSSSTDYSLKRYRFGGKEIAGSALTELGGTGAAPAAPYLDFGARLYSPRTATWLSVDPMAEEYYGIGPLTYCAGNPVNLVDPTGLAWIPRINQSTGEMEGFDWLEDTDIALDNGELPDGVYHQALFFTDSGDFNAGSKKNIGTSLAVAYLADGSIRLFDACTYPSDLIRYPTIPEGGYEASVGTHKGSYIALKMYDIGKGLSDNTIELGFQNPAYTDGRTYAMGVDIHKAGFNNSTGMTSDRKPISAACFLIDINRWDDFINLFNTDSQRNNKVGVMVSRHRAAPIIPNY